MNIEDIQKQWEQDCQINPSALDEASLDSARLHSKYLDLFNSARLTLKRKEAKLDSLKHEKWMYYSGKMTKVQMDELGWAYDPWAGGVKPMKSELNQYIDSDKDVQNSKLAVEYYKVLTSTLEEILNHIRWRSSNIRNIIDWRKFQAGI